MISCKILTRNKSEGENPMKKHFKKAIALMLVVTVVLTTAIVPVSADSQANNLTVNTGQGIAMHLLGRSYTDWSSLNFNEDEFTLGNIARFTFDSSNVEKLKDSKVVEDIIMDADVISSSADKIETIYTDGNTKIVAITNQFKDAWDKYVAMLNAAKDLAELQQERESSTDADRINQLDILIPSSKSLLELSVKTFVDAMSICDAKSLDSVLTELFNNFWNSGDKASSCLGAYENYLRQKHLFEHQLKPDLEVLMQAFTDSTLQIFLLYEEYHSYIEVADPAKFSTNPYAKDYFSGMRNDTLVDFNNMAVSTGYAGYMVTKALSNDELQAIRNYDPDYVAPESINSSIEIDNETYNCYRVKANDDLNYYLILKSFPKNDINKIYDTNYLTKDPIQVYYPEFVFDYQFIADYQYQLISDDDRPGFMSKVNKSFLSTLRDDCNLTEIPNNASHFLLYSNECHVEDCVEWDLKMLKATSKGTDSASVFSTGDYQNPPWSDRRFIAIYRDITIDRKCVDGVWKVNNSGELTNKAITIGDGQTLDLSSAPDIENTTINITGEAKILGRPVGSSGNNYTQLDLSEIRIATDKPVIIDNVYVTSKDLDYAAIKTLSSNANIIFKNNAGASGGFTIINPTKEDLYRYFSDGKPLGASSGLYVSDKANVTISGDVDFSGSYGGAGICVTNGINIVGEGDNDVTIMGSASYYSYDLGEYYPETIGAGIGGCFGTRINHTKMSGDGLFDEPEYVEMVDLRRNDYIGENSSIKISGIKGVIIGAKGDHFVSEDIGSVIGNGILHNNSDDSYIENSEIRLEQERINKNIATQNKGNYFASDTYTINAYTFGSNGVNDAGVSFKLYGDKGTTEWLVTDCGKDAGNWEGEFKVSEIRTSVSEVTRAVGNIEKIEVKSNSSNHWFPGAITVKSKFGGETLTVYGGRWIGENSIILKPTDKIYKVTVQTGTESNAGTDSEIYLKLASKNGTKTSEYQLDDIHPKSNAFEKGDNASFWIYAPDNFDECTNVYLKSNHSGTAAGWKVDYITVENVQGGNGDKFTNSTGYWYEYAKTVNFGKYSGNTGVFNIEIKTSDVSKAGTDSDIYLAVYGENGKTEQINISDLAGGIGSFEKGDKDTFKIGFEAANLGKITGIDVRKNNSGTGPDWHLEYIQITEEVMDNGNAQSVRFDFNQWIEDETVRKETVTNTIVHKSPQRIDRELLSKIQFIDGVYTLHVDKSITISSEIFDYIADEDYKLKIVMNDEDKPLYEVTFDGELFEEATDIVLKKDYSLTDGKAKFDFLSKAPLPEGTKIRIYPKDSKFANAEKIYVFGKDDAGTWKKIETIVIKDGSFEFSVDKIRGMNFAEMVFSISDDVTTLDFDDKVPNTGDNSNLYIWIMLMLVTGIALTVNTYFQRKN